MYRRRRRADKKAISIKALIDRLTSILYTTPILILSGALIILWQGKQMPAGFISTFSSTAFLILVLGLFLTFWFNRSRVFFLLLVLFSSLVGLTSFTADNASTSLLLYAAYTLTSILLPLNFLFFCSLPERGVLSVWGKRHLAIVLFQALFVAGLVTAQDADLINQLNSSFLALPALHTPIPDISSLLFVFVGGILVTKRPKGKSTFKTATLGALFAVALAFHFQSIPYAVPLFYAAAGLILGLSVLQDSYSMAYLDELTELLSRRALNEELMRLDGNYAITMVDVDNFKKFNDTYGHDAGDDVLRLVSRHLKEVTGGGKAFRYGGEEFTILFAGKTTEEIMPHLETLLERIGKYEFVLRQPPSRQKRPRKKVTVTVSIGVAEANGRNSHTPEEVLKEADAALYRAKENGRNCICK